MTLKEHINNLDKRLLFVILIAVLFRFYRIEETFSFDWDQENAANSAYDFIIHGKIPLIGQELSFPGFFLGPLHNIASYLPYSVCRLKPDCTPYFFVIVGIITTAVFYLVTKKIFDRKVATIASFAHALSFVIVGTERGPNSNYFIFLTFVLMTFCIYKFFRGSNTSLFIGSFLAGIAIVNFNPIFIFTFAAYILGCILSRPAKTGIIILSILTSLINLVPLIIFNLRHDNILLVNFFNFLSQSGGSSNFFSTAFFKFWHILVPYYTDFLFYSNKFVFQFLTLSLITTAIFKVKFKNKEVVNFLILSIVVPFLGFLFYKRSIPDYYFLPSLAPLIVVLSVLLSRRFYLFLLVTTLFVFSNIFRAVSYIPNINYQLKKSVINYIVEDSKNENVNIYYNFPPGLNTGYSYLLKVNNKLPTENAKNLYIIDLTKNFKKTQEQYKHAFPRNNIKYKFIGPINIARINL